MKNKFEIGSRFRKARLFLELSQEKLGEKLSCSQSKIKSIETGRTWLPSDTAFKLSEMFDISLEWIYFGNGEMLRKENFLNNIEDLTNCFKLDTDDVNLLYVLLTNDQKRKAVLSLIKNS